VSDTIHLLIGPPLDWTASHMACSARTALHATWDRALVTCAACLQVAREPCTCGPETRLCPACRIWSRTHRSDGTTKTGGGMQITTEKQFQEEVRRLAKECGWLVYHQYNSMKSPAGFPDLVMVHPASGRLLCIELKIRGKDPTPAQQAWLDALSQVRHVAAEVWRPDDFARILALLR
jgi:hypothetical protein